MNSRLPSAIIFYGCLSLLALPMQEAYAKTEYLRVSTEQLLANPQKYWARPIIFQDTLTLHPTDAALKIGDQKYYEMATAGLGTCHADPMVIELLRAIPLNKQYVFTGTVLQREVGFFGSKSEFHIVINKFQMVVGSIDELSDELQGFIESAPRRDASAIGQQHVERLLELVQAAMVSYAEEKGVEMWELFEPGSKHTEAVMANLRAGIRATESDRGVSTMEIMSNLLWYLLEPNYPAPARPALVDEGSSVAPEATMTPAALDPAPTTTPPEDDAVAEIDDRAESDEPMAAVEVEDVEEEGPSWFERRRLRREEKKRLAAEQEQLEMQAKQEAEEPIASALSEPEEEELSWFERRKLRRAAKEEERRLAEAQEEAVRAMLEADAAPAEEEDAAIAFEQEITEQGLPAATTVDPANMFPETEEEEVVSPEKLAAQELALQEAAMEQADSASVITIEEIVSVDEEEAEALPMTQETIDDTSAEENSKALSSWFPRWRVQWNGSPDEVSQSESFTLDPAQPVPLRKEF